MSAGEWFTSRTSAAALYPAVYAKVSPAVQDDLRKGFTALGSDDTPMVRRAAAKWLGVSFAFLADVQLSEDPISLAFVNSLLSTTYYHRWITDLS